MLTQTQQRKQHTEMHELAILSVLRDGARVEMSVEQGNVRVSKSFRWGEAMLCLSTRDRRSSIVRMGTGFGDLGLMGRSRVVDSQGELRDGLSSAELEEILMFRIAGRCSVEGFLVPYSVWVGYNFRVQRAMVACRSAWVGIPS